MSEIVKYFGIPGAGKTQRLLRDIEEYSHDGTLLNHIWYSTFTKLAADDAKDRIAQKFHLSTEDVKELNFGTIHSLCLRLLEWNLAHGGDDDELGMRLELPSDRDKYLKQHDIQYPIHNTKLQEDTPESILSENEFFDKTDEERLFSVMSWCNHRCLPFEKWKSSEICFEYINPDDVVDICDGWVEYKQKHDLVDFDDMLLKTLEQKVVPSGEVLFIDEFQDLSPLLYRVFDMWSKNIDKVVVAGDDDQTIYSFSGASPRFLLDLPGDFEVLSLSHRVPENILMKAKALIETVETRQYKDYISKKPDGRFIYLQYPDFNDIIKYIPYDKEVFLLFRTNYLALKFTLDYLIPNGIPFVKLKESTKIPNIWTNKLITIRNAFVNIHQKKQLSRQQVSRLLKMLPSCSKGKPDGYVYYGKKTWIKKCTQKQWTIPELHSLFHKIPSWDSQPVLSYIANRLQTDAYIANIANEYHHFNPSNIKIGTIHSVKGLEADVVFVFNNHTATTENAILDRGRPVIDEEKRLYYVGITRAKETCVLVDNFFDNYVFDLEVIKYE